MGRKIGLGLLAVIVLIVAVIYAAGIGLLARQQHAGTPQAPAIDPGFVDEKEQAVHEAALDVGVARPKQILFGDLHVHSTFSFDAFTLSLPMSGGDGAHPVSDACDFARHCSSLDFWSINDHAITLTPRRWGETVDAIRQCNEISGSESNPDMVTYLGWEWTQVGATPSTHYGHKNVIIRGLEDDEIPTRPIAAGAPLGIKNVAALMPSPFLMGAYGLYDRKRGGLDFVTYQSELAGLEGCAPGVPVRDLPDDCRESAVTPEDLFAKLDDWGFDSLVIPHGTTWGFYTFGFFLGQTAHTQKSRSQPTEACRSLLGSREFRGISPLSRGRLRRRRHAFLSVTESRVPSELLACGGDHGSPMSGRG